MKSSARLKLVPAERVDITALIRADIKCRDWGRVHIAADKREPVALGEAKWRWR